MSDSDITIIGNLVRDPEMRFTPGGAANAKFGVAVNRKWTQKDGEKKEETSYFNVVAWGSLAENVAASLTKGQRVIVNGRLSQRTWEKDDGEKVNMVEINADNVGPDLRWATCAVSKVERDSTTQNAGNTNSQPPPPQQKQQQDDPAWGEDPF